MMKKSKGVWVKEIQGDLEGKYYTYVVSNFLYENKEVVDPYAKSAGINGIRGMVVDFNKVNLEDYVDNYFDLKSSLESLLGRDVDLLEENAIRNPILRRNIDNSKQLIYR